MRGKKWKTLERVKRAKRGGIGKEDESE